MRTLEIDIETFSSADLAKSGVYRYCESPDFEVLLFAYSVDGGEVKVIDIAQGEKLPNEILEALTDDSVEKWSFNASFERICLSKYLGLPSGKYLDSIRQRDRNTVLKRQRQRDRNTVLYNTEDRGIGTLSCIIKVGD